MALIPRVPMSPSTRLFLFYGIACLLIAYLPAWLLKSNLIDQPDRVLSLGALGNLLVYGLLACASSAGMGASGGKGSHLGKWIVLLLGWLVGTVGFHLLAVALGATILRYKDCALILALAIGVKLWAGPCG